MAARSSTQLNMLSRNVVGDILRRSAARHPNRRVLRFRERNYTYRELNEKVNRCAHGLMDQGIRKGDRAAILSHNSDHYVIYWWALLKIGAVITPVNWMLRSEEIRFLLDHSEASAFFVEDALVPHVEPLRDKLRSVRLFGSIPLAGSKVPRGWRNIEDLWQDRYPAAEPEIEIHHDDVATLLYTSGTEAEPKGVMNTHMNFVSTLPSAVADIRMQQDDVMLGGIPLYHVAGMWMFTACTALGGLTLLEYVPDLNEILRLTQEEKVTRWCWPTTVYINLLNVPGFDTYDLSSVRICQIFGSPAPPALLDRWRQIIPGVIFMNSYGQTEMTPLGASICGAELDERPDSVGRSMLPVELKIVGPDDEELPRGEVGEIVARGPNIMLGYFKDEQKTAQTRRNGWHHTGDLGRMDDEGYLYYVDRLKDMIKTGGENVASADVELTLFRHPKIADVAVIGLPDPVWGEAITAVVVPAPGVQIDEGEVIAWAKQNMARFKVPKRVLIVDELPRNPSGKVLKRELRKRYAR